MSDARQPEVDFLHSWAMLLPKSWDKSSLQYKFGSVNVYSLLSHRPECTLFTPPPPKFCITIVFQFLGGGGEEGVNKVRYGLCENAEYGKRPHFRLTCVTKKRLSLSFPLVSTGTVESTKNTLGSLSNNNGDGNENIT